MPECASPSESALLPLLIPTPCYPLNKVFPLQLKTGWTTCVHDLGMEDSSTGRSDHAAITRVPLEDSELGVHRISHGTTHRMHILGDGISRAWEALYPQGSYKPSAEIKGGFGFYLTGPQGEWADRLTNSKEIIFSYAVFFEEGFDFVKGGKLPGIFGGEEGKSYACTGGRKDERCGCFNLRLMWRTSGKGEIYAYLPILAANERRFLEVPGSHQNPDFGISVGRGSFKFIPGKWIVIGQRVKLNDIGHENGEVELWVDGKSVIKVSGLVYRLKPESVLQGLHCQTFFGGGTPDWASPKDQKAWFTGISGAILSDYH